jgi:hypothetical protein
MYHCMACRRSCVSRGGTRESGKDSLKPPVAYYEHPTAPSAEIGRIIVVAIVIGVLITYGTEASTLYPEYT